MELKRWFSSMPRLSLDHATSWIHLLNFYFYNCTPYFVYIPEHYYKRVFITFGLITFCHICLNVTRFLTNKKKIAERQDRAGANLKEVEENLQNITEAQMELSNLSFDELSSKLKDGSLSPISLLVAFQKKAVETSKSNAVAEYITNIDLTVTDTSDGKAEDIDDLFGIPISITELIELHEKDRTLGLGGFVAIPAKADAVIVKILKACGAVPFIRTNLSQAHPLCPSLASSNPIFGHTSHPKHLSRSAGGGSCGEACALALHASVLGVGADLAGGVRIPACFCGVAALRTTSQRISTQGLMQSQSAVATCVGPMARDVSALVAFMRSVGRQKQAELDPNQIDRPFDEELFSSTEPLRIGYFIEDGYTRTTPAVIRAINEAKKYLEKNGHKLVPFRPPDMKQMMSELLYPAALGSNDILWELLSRDIVDPSIRGIYYKIQVNNALRWIFSWWIRVESPMEAALEGAYLPLTMADWWHLSTDIQDFRRSFLTKWKQSRLDVMLCPVLPCAAVKLGNEARLLACLTHVGLFSLLNYPAGTVPITSVKHRDLTQLRSSSSYLAETSLERFIVQDQVGEESDPESSAVGFPVGVQVAALPFYEENVLRVMASLEQCRKASGESSKASTASSDPQKASESSVSPTQDGASKPSDTQSVSSARSRVRGEEKPVLKLSISKIKPGSRQSYTEANSSQRESSTERHLSGDSGSSGQRPLADKDISEFETSDDDKNSTMTKRMSEASTSSASLKSGHRASGGSSSMDRLSGGSSKKSGSITDTRKSNGAKKKNSRSSMKFGRIFPLGSTKEVPEDSILSQISSKPNEEEETRVEITLDDDLET